MRDAADHEAPAPHSKRLGRELAMEFLFSCELKREVPGAAAFDVFMESVKDEFKLADNRLTRRAREYAVKLYEAVALDQRRIDGIIVKYCHNWDMDRISPVDRNIMRVAVAEMLAFPEVPHVVSIDEAVEIARDFSGAEAGNFINGVLNSIKNREFAEEPR
ncbi:MAG: transcription antitermination factor NusB [Lentisphaeria bacterium]|nr:transcription antitermination factor NusB [Lentisphaeria bacterium]